VPSLITELHGVINRDSRADADSSLPVIIVKTLTPNFPAIPDFFCHFLWPLFSTRPFPHFPGARLR